MSSFDAVADRYDEFRHLPPGVPEAVREAVRAGVGRPVGRMLEVGAGTGRIGAAFAAAGDEYVGADASGPMLERFAAKFRARGNPMPRLIRADGMAMPFSSASFHVVMMISLLSGVRGWRVILDEARRLLRPGGSLVIGRTVRPDDGIDARMKDQLAAILAAMGIDARKPGAGREDARDRLILQSWSHGRKLVARWEAQRAPSNFLTRHPTGARFSLLPETIRDEALDRLRTWALDTFGSLDATVPEPHGFELDIFTFDL